MDGDFPAGRVGVRASAPASVAPIPPANWYNDGSDKRDIGMGKLSDEQRKRATGRYLTEGDPFGYDAVTEWVGQIIEATAGRPVSACEPYAGKNFLPSALMSRFKADFKDGIEWVGYDISPCDDGENLLPECKIKKADTLMSIPTTHDVIVTNPPYLARNSARRRHLPFPFDHQGVGIASPADLYQIALDSCLASAPWCAMLIPESFITSKYDKSRLISVISLPGDLFLDTECPVCLALFGPDPTGDYDIHANDGRLLGHASDVRRAYDEILERGFKASPHGRNLTFNAPDGILGLRGVDSSLGVLAHFVDGKEIDPSSVRQTSRSVTRIAVDDMNGKDVADVIDGANRLLGEWREATGDVFMTAFKGVNKQTHAYRRRLSFREAEAIVNAAIFG